MLSASVNCVPVPEVAAVEVGRVVADGVAQLPGRAALDGVEGDLSGVLAVAGALDHLVEGGDDGARVGVDEGVQPARRLVGERAGGQDVVGQARRAGAGPDDELSLALLTAGGGALLAGGQGLLLRDAGARGPRRDVLAAGVVAHLLEVTAPGLLDDEVAADDAQALPGAVVAGVRGAVTVGDDGSPDELLVRAQPEGGAVLVGAGLHRGRHPGRGGGGDAGREERGDGHAEGEAAVESVHGFSIREVAPGCPGHAETSSSKPLRHNRSCEELTKGQELFTAHGPALDRTHRAPAQAA